MPGKGKNKVKFNLKNVHVAPINRETGEYDTVFAVPGAVKLALDPQGDITKFYADGVVYYKSAPNNGYEGTLELAMVPDEFLEKIFNEVPNDEKVMLENVDDVFTDFALGFQVDGDVHNTLFWYYNCTASRPSQEAETNTESKTPQTETLNISCTCDEDGNVRAKTTDETSDDVRGKWFDSVYKKASEAV